MFDNAGIDSMGEMNDGRDICLSIEKKHTIFQTYLSITRKLKNVVGEGKEKTLRKLLSQRRYCIKQIQNIDGVLGEITGFGGSDISSIHPKNRTRVHQYLNNIKELMETIAPLDSEVMVLVRSESNALRSELLEMRHTRKATRGYGSIAGGPPRFLDTRS